MEAKDETYNLCKDVVIEIVSTPDSKDPMMGGFGVVFMSGEEKIPGAKKGSDEEYSHNILEHIQFKDRLNLKLFQMGLELMQAAIDNEEEY